MKTAYLFIVSMLMGCASAFAQTTVNNLKTNVLSLTKQGSTPSNAATGTLKFYSKSDDKLYTVTSGGTETQIGPPSFANVGSSPAATGASVSGNTITLQPASGTQPGLMLAASQTLGGAKTWNGGQNLASYLEFDSAAAPATTGDDVTLASPTKVTNVLADDALNSIAGITGPGNARFAVYINSSGESIVLRNNSGSAGVGDKIITGSGADYTVIDGSSVSMVYDTANAVWRIMGGPGPVAGVVGIANGGTNSSTSLNNNRVMRSSGGAIVEAAAITASRALISDANGIPTHSATTATELGYVNGVTSAIQTQLGTKITNPGSAIAGALLKLNDSAVPAWGYFGPGNNSSAATISASRDRVLLSGTGTYTVTLPLANSYAPGHRLILIKTSSTLNTITIARNGSDLIDLGTSSVSSVSAVTPAEQWDFITDGVSNWYVVAHITSTPWTSFTPTLNSNTGVANNNAWWRRVGDSIELRYAIIYNGAGANSDFTASPPSGLQIDTSKLSLSNTYGYGNAMWFDNGVGWKTGSVSLFSSVSLTIYMDGAGANFNTNTLANLDTISMNVTFPITGWYP